MQNSLRQFMIGGVYHIVNRGYEKRNIYLEEADYLRFIDSLYYFNDKNVVKIREIPTGQTGGDKSERKCIVEVLVFTLMPNHYHIVLREIIKGGISLFMQKLNTGYTGYFNTKYDRIGMGGIFQSRYKSVSVKNEIQLGNVFAYVHTNPVGLIEPKWKDLIVKDKNRAINYLENYKWSSYHDYVGNIAKGFPKVTQREFFLELYKDEESCRHIVEDWINFKAENSGSEIIE